MARLGDIMHGEVYAASPDTSVSEVAKKMVKGRFGSAVVTKSDVLVGIFTERDVLRAAAAAADLANAPISAWMTKDPETASADDDSDEAANTMLSRGFRHLPVVDGNKVIGIVSLRDVLATRIRKAPS